MITRLIQLEDFDAIYTMWQTVCDKLYPYEEEKNRFIAMMQLNSDLCLLVEEKGTIVGTILGAFDGRNGSIHRLIIASDYQQKGLGKMLVQELERLLKAKGVHKFIAQIHAQNRLVVPFYEKLGFSEMTYVSTFYKDI